MATYQEQIAKFQEKKNTQELFFGAFVDALLPYIQNGKLSDKDCADILKSFIANLQRKP